VTGLCGYCNVPLVLFKKATTKTKELVFFPDLDDTRFLGALGTVLKTGINCNGKLLSAKNTTM